MVYHALHEIFTYRKLLAGYLMTLFRFLFVTVPYKKLFE